MWQWAPAPEQLLVGLQVWRWDVVALGPVCPPSLQNTSATKLGLLFTLPWEERHARQRTREHSVGRMTYT